MIRSHVPLSLFHGLGSSCDDPAVVQVWAAHFDRAAEAERAAFERSKARLFEAFIPLTLAVFTLAKP